MKKKFTKLTAACSANTGKLKYLFFVKMPSRYMIKKYGYDMAFAKVNGIHLA